MPSDFVAETARQADGITVRWYGDVDLASAPRAVATVADLDLTDGERLRLCLDTVTFIDSTGLRCLLEVRQHVNDAGAHLELIAPAGCVVRVLELAGLMNILSLDGDAPAS